MTHQSRILHQTQIYLADSLFSGGTPVLVEASYGHKAKTCLQSSDSDFKPMRQYPSTLCIAGGAGITAIVPAVNTSGLYGCVGKTKLYSGVRHQGLVDAVESMLPQTDSSNSKWAHIVERITVESRSTSGRFWNWSWNAPETLG
ncbi:hypothetical protein QQZ08_009127 [Neonectria magnoliae]|uniref:Uncharacterized protein n=1 Tax=Neonectria magnoliae TaxID=2732573 RepID=A0ABR1HQG8_9HYPO